MKLRNSLLFVNRGKEKNCGGTRVTMQFDSVSKTIVLSTLKHGLTLHEIVQSSSTDIYCKRNSGDNKEANTIG